MPSGSFEAEASRFTGTPGRARPWVVKEAIAGWSGVVAIASGPVPTSIAFLPPTSKPLLVWVYRRDAVVVEVGNVGSAGADRRRSQGKERRDATEENSKARTPR